MGRRIEFGPPWCELRLYATYIETQHNDVDLKYHVQTVWAREVGMRKWERGWNSEGGNNTVRLSEFRRKKPPDGKFESTGG